MPDWAIYIVLNTTTDMVDVVPVLLLVFGSISVLKPEWVAAVHRRQKAAGTTSRPSEIEVTGSWLALTRVTGVFFVLFGLYFASRSL